MRGASQLLLGLLIISSFWLPTIVSGSNTIYRYDLVIHSLTVFNDHDSPGKGEIFLKISIGNEEIRVPSDSHYSMSDNDEVQVNWEKIFSTNSPINIKIEVREDDDGPDDSLGSFYLPNTNFTKRTFYTSNPSDAKLVISMTIINQLEPEDSIREKKQSGSDPWITLLYILGFLIIAGVIYYFLIKQGMI